MAVEEEKEGSDEEGFIQSAPGKETPLSADSDTTWGSHRLTGKDHLSYSQCEVNSVIYF